MPNKSFVTGKVTEILLNGLAIVTANKSFTVVGRTTNKFAILTKHLAVSIGDVVTGYNVVWSGDNPQPLAIRVISHKYAAENVREPLRVLLATRLHAGEKAPEHLVSAFPHALASLEKIFAAEGQGGFFATLANWQGNTGVVDVIAGQVVRKNDQYPQIFIREQGCIDENATLGTIACVAGWDVRFINNAPVGFSWYIVDHAQHGLRPLFEDLITYANELPVELVEISMATLEEAERDFISSGLPRQRHGQPAPTHRPAGVQLARPQKIATPAPAEDPAPETKQVDEQPTEVLEKLEAEPGPEATDKEQAIAPSSAKPAPEETPEKKRKRAAKK